VPLFARRHHLGQLQADVAIDLGIQFLQQDLLLPQAVPIISTDLSVVDYSQPPGPDDQSGPAAL